MGALSDQRAMINGSEHDGFVICVSHYRCRDDMLMFIMNKQCSFVFVITLVWCEFFWKCQLNIKMNVIG